MLLDKFNNSELSFAIYTEIQKINLPVLFRNVNDGVPLNGQQIRQSYPSKIAQYVRDKRNTFEKSLKNFVSISELLNKFKGETIRYFLLQSHYRAPLNFSNNSLLEANTSLSSLYRSVEDLSINGDPDKEILTNLEDDVNTPKVFSRLHYLSEQANKGSNEAAQLLKNSSPILGLLENTSDNWFKTNSFNQDDLSIKKLTKRQILELIEKRANAKTKKDFELADKIRKSGSMIPFSMQ